jgi:PadR family transcriptional regulator, regulatory protein AphA
MKQAPRIGTTGCAILGLLAVEPGSAYDLTQRMTRNYRFVWPRAESKLFEEIKRLAKLGLVRGERGFTGRRRRTLYRITAAGRRALRRWLPEPPQPPSLSFEALLKVAYADFADRRALLATLAAVEAHAQSMLDFGDAIAREILADGWSMPERAHLQTLSWRFLWDHYTAMRDWAAWARREVRAWKATRGSESLRRRADRILAGTRRTSRRRTGAS